MGYDNMFVFKVVSDNVEIFDTVEELTNKYNQIGVVEGHWLKEELQGQPRLEGLVGAMYDGMTPEGKHVIRYETAEVYEMLSR